MIQLNKVNVKLAKHSQIPKINLMR